MDLPLRTHRFEIWKNELGYKNLARAINHYIIEEKYRSEQQPPFRGFTSSPDSSEYVKNRPCRTGFLLFT